MGREVVYTWFWWGNLRERSHLEDPSIDVTIIFKWMLKKWEGAGTRLIWFRIGAGGGLLGVQ